ncbi:alpha/beta hydrolase [Psychrosphaera sp. G1-22]|uniref:Alpha/beta hydrolase n=1 Tax=Psychrosphaera algicola TaxID=3023714 RepID=A0ABT5F9D0_9GAMM|nr:alpha/beta hydrolase [Psychrosphaera sp. G1-22]MDC2888134.1 alpha/beta hydrolase [Psychrosphaera sp. G1-22]
MRLFMISLIFISSSSFSLPLEDLPAGLTTDIPIGKVDGLILRINIALPARQNKTLSPVMVFIHGGGLIKGDKSKFNKHLEKMAKRGVVAASVMYRLAPEYRFPAAIEDVKSAIRF